jgi:alpha-D-ribose 1-methylphosphonate 5-phosphate C-P lyase
MIELTEQQIRALQSPEAAPPRVVNPQTQETFVLLRVEEYERLKAEEYDDSPWTREELEALAWETGKAIGWEEMDEYDRLPEKP